MKKHILVVDKDQLILYGLAKALKDDGCEVKTAETAAEAIEKLSDCPYDLCLLDVYLADINGPGLINIINDICPETKVILMAADSPYSTALSENEPDGPSRGTDYYIPKPFTLSDVTEIVQQVLNGEVGKNTGVVFPRNNPGNRSRKHTRKTCGEDVCFGLSVIHEGVCTRISMQAQAVDICDSGIGLLTSYPLRENQVIGFDEKMDSRVGVVAWSRMIGKESFRVGVRFA